MLDAILNAILEQRIPPGTKLKEEALASIFGVSRTRIRRILWALSHRRVVELRPNKGAVVARPSAEDARDVFSARQAVEALILQHAVERTGPADLAQLRAHLQAEAEAQRSGRREDAIRLAGEFHLLLAHLSGSRVFFHQFEPLVSQSSLILLIYGGNGVSSCSHDEHSAIVAAIEARDLDNACKIMRKHLDHIGETLSLNAPSQQVNLAQILVDSMQKS